MSTTRNELDVLVRRVRAVSGVQLAALGVFVVSAALAVAWVVDGGPPVWAWGVLAGVAFASMVLHVACSFTEIRLRREIRRLS